MVRDVENSRFESTVYRNNRSIRENPIVYLGKDPIETPIVDRSPPVGCIFQHSLPYNPILVGATQHKETETHDSNRRNPNVRQPTAKGTKPSKHCRQLEEENANLLPQSHRAAVERGRVRLKLPR